MGGVGRGRAKLCARVRIHGRANPVGRVGVRGLSRAAPASPEPAGPFAFSAVERVWTGRSAGSAVAEECGLAGARRVLIACGSHVRARAEAVAQGLPGLEVRTWTGVRAHSPCADVVALARELTASGADLLVAIGGGSVIDAAKLAAFAAANGALTPDAFEGLARAPETARAPDVRLVCAPTTLSGGEFNSLSGFTRARDGRKLGVNIRALAPVAVVLDPSLTLETPEWLWLSTGVRAIDHAVEALEAPVPEPFADGLAALALEELLGALPAVRDDPGDLRARQACQVGAWRAMLPLVGGTPMGVSHAIGHVLGGLCGVAHGHTSCVMAPAALAWNAAGEGVRIDRLRTILGGEPAGALDRFIRALGLPRSLGEVGVDRARFEAIAQMTLLDPWTHTNARRVASAADIMEILERAA